MPEAKAAENFLYETTPTRAQNSETMMRANEKHPAAREAILKVAENVGRVIRGKDDVIELVLAALLAGGHVLLEDVPGVGKTMLAKSLARSLQADFRRVQFTPDLLPSDITGTNIYRADEHRFEFRQGPIFTNVLLADELNRATPRTQSSLLEAMEERQVSADGTTYSLPAFFFVIATQNPVEQEGVYSLPEAQLDRFLMQLTLGYPSRADEAALVRERLAHDPFFDLSPVASVDDVLAARRELLRIHVDVTVLSYTLSLVEATRRHEDILLGASPRATLALTTAGRALAYLRSRDYVLPDDIKELALPVLSHRLMLQPRALIAGRRPAEVVREILNQLPVPLHAPNE